MTKLADLDPVSRARVAALIVDQLGLPAVQAHQREHRIRPPGPGRAVLACRCGRVLNTNQMHRASRRTHRGDAARIDPIVCPECTT